MPYRSLELDGIVIEADEKASHCCQTGTFPASYTSYDRFVRLSVLKSLNNNGNDFSDEQILPFGIGILNSVYEPHSKGVFHGHSYPLKNVIRQM